MSVINLLPNDEKMKYQVSRYLAQLPSIILSGFQVIHNKYSFFLHIGAQYKLTQKYTETILFKKIIYDIGIANNFNIKLKA